MEQETVKKWVRYEEAKAKKKQTPPRIQLQKKVNLFGVFLTESIFILWLFFVFYMGRLLLFLIIPSLVALSFLSGIFKKHKFKNKNSCFNTCCSLSELGRGTISVVQDCEQVPPHDMAGITLRCHLAAASHHRIHPRERQIEDHKNSKVLVGSDMGTDTLRSRLWRKVLLRHRRLRLRESRVRRRSQTAGDIGGVHSQRRRRFGLLRREFGRRLQPSDADRRQGRHQGRVQRHRLPRRPQRRVSSGAEGGAIKRQPRERGVPERVRGLRGSSFLLQWSVLDAWHVWPFSLFTVLQARLSTRV